MAGLETNQSVATHEEQQPTTAQGVDVMRYSDNDTWQCWDGTTCDDSGPFTHSLSAKATIAALLQPHTTRNHTTHM